MNNHRHFQGACENHVWQCVALAALATGDYLTAMRFNSTVFWSSHSSTYLDNWQCADADFQPSRAINAYSPYEY